MPPSMRVPPKNNNGPALLLLGVFALGVVGLIFYKQCGSKEDVAPIPVATSTASAAPSGTLQVDDLPPPPVIEDATAPTSTKATTASDPCGVKSCNGTTTSELESALAFRAKQAHRCYDSALANDSSLKGKVELQLRVASNGNVCEVDVTGNDMGTTTVSTCVQNWFRSAGHFPSPKGGCIDAKVPISFVPGGR